MDRQEWRETIQQLPVFDTHTHLNMPGVPIPAQDFWDIAHYFWFQQELWSVGYPRDAANMPTPVRTNHFVAAFNAVRNTDWRHIVCRICSDLYETSLVDTDGLTTPEHVAAVNRAIRERSQAASWPRSVVERLGIRKIAINSLRDIAFEGLPDVPVAIPTWEDRQAWVAKLTSESATRATQDAAREAIAQRVAELAEMGIRGMRVVAEPFEQHGKEAVMQPNVIEERHLQRWQAEAFISHALFAALGEHDMFAQLFLGVERDVSPRTAMGVNDPRRIINLYPLFERYTAGFELVIGAPQNNLDAAQAARIYPNVHVGGLWWYNFRRSTYTHTFQVRVEAVPASKSAIVASDARCIEWCYGKILLVKTVLADFLHEQVTGGWLSDADALWIAREWLHDAAARRYLANG